MFKLTSTGRSSASLHGQKQSVKHLQNMVYNTTQQSQQGWAASRKG
jgi:hypothetical protein